MQEEQYTRRRRAEFECENVILVLTSKISPYMGTQPKGKGLFKRAQAKATNEFHIYNFYIYF